MSVVPTQFAREISTQSIDTSEAVLCAHCGDICGSETVSERELSFCCAGCKSVYTILRHHDLCEYYGRETAGVAMKNVKVANEQYAILDNREVRAKLLSFSGPQLERITWTIPTLHCASCVWLLEQLNRLDAGVIASNVDIMRKSITVDYDPRATSLRHVAETLSSIGYAPLLRLEGDPRLESSTRGLYTRIGLAGFATVNTMLIAFAQYFAGSEGVDPALRSAMNIIAIVLSVPVLIYGASPWFTAAISSIRQRHISLDVPVAIGILAIFSRSMIDIIGGRGEGYLDSFNALVFLLLIGRLFQQKAFDALSFDRSYRSFFPLSVRVFRNDEDAVVRVEQVRVGDILIVRNGEVIPCDALLDSEGGYIDYSFVTGESVPVETLKGQTVHAGGRVVGRAITLTAQREVAHSELANMWDRTWKRAPRTTFLTVSDTFGKYFTYLAVFLAMGGALLWLPDTEMAFNVFTAVLIIACPCALTLSAPITLGTAMGKLGNLGIYLKNVGTLLELERVTSIFFDKTGTLTESGHQLKYTGREISENEWIAVRAIAAQSAHPISRSIAAGYVPTPVTNVIEFIGKGISGVANGLHVAIGSSLFISERAIGAEEAISEGAKTTHIAIDGVYAGAYSLKPQLRKGVIEMIRTLRESGMRTRVVSGDTDRDAAILAPVLGGESLVFNCRPEEKIARVEEAQHVGDRVLMVGDGLNDAGAMGAADVAIAVTEDTATLVPACDIIIRSQTVRALPSLLDYAKRVKNVILTAFIVSIFYNIMGLSLAIMGMLSPLVAAVLMPVSSLTVIAVSVFGAKLMIKQLEGSLKEGTASWA